MHSSLPHISWETVVRIAASPGRLIHFNVLTGRNRVLVR